MNINDILNTFKNDRKVILIFIVGILGIILLVISNFFSSNSIDTNEDKIKNEQTNTVLTAQQLEERLEDRLKEAISQINGVGKTTVMVTISSAGEYIYAKNNSSKTDSDSSVVESEIVIYDSGDSDSGLIISIKSPDVLGVAIICEGGNSAVIKSEVTNLVTSLFGIGSDRVYVGAKS